MAYQVQHHFILFSVIFLAVGFLIGHYLANNKSENNHKPESFFAKEKRESVAKQNKKSTIDIDESTHVVKIHTKGLEKQYDNIAKEKTTQEDITSSINKLKNLKK